MKKSLSLLLVTVALIVTNTQSAFAQSDTICWAGADTGDTLIRFEEDGTGQIAVGVFQESATLRRFVETMAWHASEGQLYAYDGNRLGLIDTADASFTTRGLTTSCALPSGDILTLDDIDGLSWDPITGDLWGVERNATGVGLSAGEDVLLRLTTAGAPQAEFSGGATCVEIDTASVGQTDIDDMTFDQSGTLYAIANSGTALDNLVIINRTDGSVTNLGVIELGDGTDVDDVEGLSVTVNGGLIATTGNSATFSNTLYNIDKATAVATELALLLDTNGATLLRDYEALACVGTSIALQKTVYASHDGGANCPGMESVATVVGADVTYCFEVTNDGRVPLDNVSVDDLDIGANLAADAGDVPLLPGESVTMFFESTNTGDLINTAQATGTASTAGGTAIPGLNDPRVSDTAAVRVNGPAATPIIGLAKRVTALVDNGGGHYSVFFTLAVENFGSEGLDNVQVEDALSVSPNNFPASAIGRVLATTGGLTANPGYDGQVDVNTLAGSDSLAVAGSATIDIVVDFIDDASGPYINQALAVGVGLTSDKQTSDFSDDGAHPDDGNGIPNEPVDNDPTVINVGGGLYAVPALGPLGLGALVALLLVAGVSRLGRDRTG